MGSAPVLLFMRTTLWFCLWDVRYLPPTSESKEFRCRTIVRVGLVLCLYNSENSYWVMSIWLIKSTKSRFRISHLLSEWVIWKRRCDQSLPSNECLLIDLVITFIEKNRPKKLIQFFNKVLLELRKLLEISTVRTREIISIGSRYTYT